jgi:DNA topoisomerase I
VVATAEIRKRGSARRSPPKLERLTPGPEWARAASLRYASDDTGGITRHRSGTGFTYRDAKGVVIRDRDTRARIAALVIPPAWTRVWISPDPSGHIQATGRDARGRKQYRYHPRWKAVRDESKYDRMLQFGALLPGIRTRVNADLAAPAHSRERVLAVVVRLLETTYIRVGNEEYARDNGTFGLTTLRNRHLRVSGDTMYFDFKGKSGKVHSVLVTDRRLARLVRGVRDLPGQQLFQYRDAAGELRPVGSGDVNAYLREIAGAEFTAKDFRTWAGTLLAATLLGPVKGADADTAMTVPEMLRQVSRVLGNTPAVCRSGYIHPTVLAAHADAAARERWRELFAKARSRAGLTREESALLSFLEP